MICRNCGKELPENSRFCPYCGSPAEKPPAGSGQPGPNVLLCDDGKYRWVYEIHLLKNPTFFFLVWKILFFILLGIALFSLLISACDSCSYFVETLPENLRMWGLMFLGMTVLTVLGYLLYAAMMGGKYVALFEMDENGVNHKQLPKQAKKAKAVAGATFLAGLATGSLSTMGLGLNSARTEMYSSFACVRKVKTYPRSGLIKVNGLLSRNRVYAAKEDFPFVSEYILARCQKKK